MIKSLPSDLTNTILFKHYLLAFAIIITSPRDMVDPVPVVLILFWKEIDAQEMPCGGHVDLQLLSPLEFIFCLSDRRGVTRVSETRKKL